MRLCTAAQMRALDQWTIEHGTPGHVLMERAGKGATRVLRRSLPRGRTVVVCGRGNNGGDGFVIARHLRRAGAAVEVWLAGSPKAVQGDAARMLAAWRRAGGRVHECTTAADVAALRRGLERAAVVVDALLGTGLNAPVAGLHAEIIDAMNGAGRPIFAVDIASGLSADTGRPLGTAVHATLTATFGHPKVGQHLYPGIEHTGTLEIVDIGLRDEGLATIGPAVDLLEAGEVGRLLPPRPRGAHKGTFGHVLVIAGSRGKSGAALLAAEAAGRAGAGLVTLASAAALQPVLEGHVREAMTASLPDGRDGTMALGDGIALTRLLEGKAAVVCGPGVGANSDTRILVAAIARTARAPLVVDADGLNCVAGTSVLRERPAATVVTPHPGEMSRLLEITIAEVQADRLRVARQLAARDRIVVVLKGARTIVAAPDGQAAVVPTGNPGMASGGTGDVLAGIVGGLLAQGLQPFDAARLGAFAHGLAGDRVALRQGETGLLAHDLLDELPPTLATLQSAV
ncbi:MAG TPA: NAD(P)H-hydrate dehydratase [Candidatus Eisenbacteria bacterium]|nr:NAD(P)H-hydrate dehydratase [Candidatus Eisenbacteria bacterium]